ncbi:hypothetical protein Ddye_005515 [Dipteronia dyeriana]|uniref:RNase H type-1 domain-containing protein n=1 Tax=Dipteronia dyeriana TaxID=168575 RepID=A0AAD9XGT4_9ROSI|nr:hypothetical protein Ddye_005515 [Dipteronia dyeriana]
MTLLVLVVAGEDRRFLFFTDGSLLFSRVADRDFQAIRRVLDSYTLASGQMVNFHKSSVCVSIKVSRERADNLARILAIRLIPCHKRYLGLPSLVGKNRRTLFASIKDRVWDQLNGWQSKLFSIGVKRFWWGNNTGVPGKICHSKDASSLGFQDFVDINLGLMVGQIKLFGFKFDCLLVEIHVADEVWYIHKCGLHNEDELCYNEMVPWARAFQVDYRRANQLSNGDVPDWRSIDDRWKPPHERVYKINTDAAVAVGGGRVGIGIIIRDFTGNVMASSSQPVRVGYFVYIVKALAILRGLQLARDMRLLPCFIEYDAQVVVNLKGVY